MPPALARAPPSANGWAERAAGGGGDERRYMYRNQWLCGALPDQFFEDGVNDGLDDTEFVDDDSIWIGTSTRLHPKSTNIALGIDCETLDEDGRNGIILAVIADDMTALEIALADETQNVRPPPATPSQQSLSAARPGPEAVHTRGCRSIGMRAGGGAESLRHWLRVAEAPH